MGEFLSPTPPASTTQAGKVQLAGDLSGTSTSPTVPALIPGQLGTLTIIGHSYTAGASLPDAGASNVFQESLVSTLQGLMKIHEHNVNHLGQAAASLSGITNIVDSGFLFGGWSAISQWILPNNNPNINAANDPTTLYSHAVLAGGAAVIVHGHNDITQDYKTNITNVAVVQQAIAQNAWKNALRFVLSRLRTNNLFGSSITTGTTTIAWDSNLAFGTASGGVFTGGGGHWSDVASVTQNTGPAYKSSVTNNDAVQFTIPKELAGATIGFNIIGQLNKLGYLTGNMTNVVTSLGVNSDLGNTTDPGWPQSGNYVIQIDNEQMLVTGGQGTTTWTGITRGFNATTHSTNAAIQMAANMTCTFSGTATNATGTVTVGAQGHHGSPTMITKRFVTTAADAGKTIIATFSGIPTGDTYSAFWFDSVQSEALVPPPTVVTNLQHFNFNETLADVQPLISNWNTATTSVVNEFDSYVQICDLYTAWWKNNGTVSGSGLNNTNATSTFTWVGNDSSYTPTVGEVWTTGGFQTSNNLGTNTTCGEHMTVTAVSGAFPNWSITVDRGSDGTGKAAHASGTWIYPSKWQSRYDDLHPSPEGHKVIGNLIFKAFQNIPQPSVSEQFAIVDGNWSQGAQVFGAGPRDNYWRPAVTPIGLTTGIPAANTAYYLKTYIPKICTLVGMASIVTIGTTATVRYGMYFDDVTRETPGRLLCDSGAVTKTSGSAPWVHQVTGMNQVLRPGWYWTCFVNQGGGQTFRIIQTGVTYPIIGDISVPTQAIIPYAIKQLSVSGALADTAYLAIGLGGGGTVTGTGANVPIVYMQLRAPMY